MSSGRLVGSRIDIRRGRGSRPETCELPLEEPPLRLEPGQRQRTGVSGAGIGGPPEPAAQLSSGGMGEPVLGELPAGQHLVDQRQPGFWPVSHRDGDRPIEIDHR